jgi:RNA polymerase sigma factor (sigma-70 family)
MEIPQGDKEKTNYRLQNPESIYKQYNKKIYNLAYRITGNIDDAHDITQETFIQAFSSIDKFKGESQIYTWLYRIAKNNCLRFLKEKNRTTFLSLKELVDNVSTPVSEEISETEKSFYIAQVKDGCLSGLLRCLSLQQRLAFILNVLLNLSIEQVAIVIEKSENATRILVHRSKQNIKEYLCCNCSLYDLKNPCHCENLIHFSLKKAWINLELNENILQAESEIKNLKDVVHLYKTLKEKTPTENFNKHFQHFLTNKKEFLILNDKKVK